MRISHQARQRLALPRLEGIYYRNACVTLNELELPHGLIAHESFALLSGAGRTRSLPAAIFFGR